jgi:RNA polymerase sigma-70 factor, ECF subfamily
MEAFLCGVTFTVFARLQVVVLAAKGMTPESIPQPEPLADEGAEGGNGVMSAWRFRLAVLMHDRVVFRVAAALLRDSREAEDVTQEVFLSYWQYGAGVERPREWLLRVARNACLNRFRRSGRVVNCDPAELPDISDGRDPEWHYEQHELAIEMRALVDTLPEPQRSLLVMFDMQGLDGATCARVLGLNANQVKVYLHRARRKLREQLERAS